jgi:hypothetical protein
MRFSDWLGRLRRLRSSRSHRRISQRLNHTDLGLQVDTLEDRTLLAATTTIALDGMGNIVVTDTDGGNTADRLNLSTNAAGTTFNFFDNFNQLTTSIPGATGDGTNFVTVPLAGVSGVIINTLGGADEVTIRDINAPASLNLTVNGGDGDDSTELRGAVSLAGGDLTINNEEIVFIFGGVVSNTDDVVLNAVASDTKTLNAAGSIFPLAVAQVNLNTGSQVTANSFTATAQATTTATVNTTIGNVDSRANADVLIHGT